MSFYKRAALFLALLGLFLLRAALAEKGFTVDLQTALI